MKPSPPTSKTHRSLLASTLMGCLLAAGLWLGLPLSSALAQEDLASSLPQGVLVAEKPLSATLEEVCEATSPTPPSSTNSELRRAPATNTGYTSPEGKFYDHVLYATNSRLGLGIAWTEPRIGTPTDIYVIANNTPSTPNFRFDGLDLAYLGTDNSGKPAWLVDDYIMDTSQFIYPASSPLHRDPASPELSITFTSSDTFLVLVRVGPAANTTGADRFTAEYLRVAITVSDPAYPSVRQKSKQLAAQAKTQLGANASQYDLALWAHDWIIDHMDYDYTYGFYGAEGALTRGLGTCESYHRGLVMVLNDLGIETGRQVDDNHVWTLAKLDGTWCTIDATWDDTDYNLSASFPGIPSLRHIYFGLDEATTALVHPKLEPANVPLNSLKNCHLIRSGDLDYFTNREVPSIASKLKSGQLSFSQEPYASSLGSSISNPIYHLVALQLGQRSWTVRDATTNHVQFSYGAKKLSVNVPTGLVTNNGHQEYWTTQGTQAKNQWVSVSGKRYYFDGNGVMATGWLTQGGARYYLGSDGAMVTGWQTLNNRRYYFNTSGQMVTGWVTISGTRRYFNSDGTLASGWTTISGKRCYLTSEGALASGWVTISGKRTYLTSQGTPASGWQLINNRWYYLTASGTPTTGWQRVGGAWYWLNGDGTMATGWVYTGGAWYYLTSSGAMATGWQWVGGHWYYLNGSGAMATGWLWTGGAWYYLTSSGAMATGWQWVGGHWYYLNGSGAMAAKRWIGNYYVTGSGAMATNTWIGRYHVNGSGLWDRTR